MAFNQTNAPNNLGIPDFLSQVSALGGLARGCKFAVKIEPTGSAVIPLAQNNSLMYMCDAVDFPGRGFNLTEVRYYGPSMALPNNTQYEVANLSFLCRVASRERQFFDDWMDIINPTGSFNFEYAENYYSRIKIYQLGETPAAQGSKAPLVTYAWQLNKAWPILVNPQSVTWADQDVLRLQVSFTYKWWDRPDKQ